MTMCLLDRQQTRLRVIGVKGGFHLPGQNYGAMKRRIYRSLGDTSIHIADQHCNRPRTRGPSPKRVIPGNEMFISQQDGSGSREPFQGTIFGFES